MSTNLLQIVTKVDPMTLLDPNDLKTFASISEVSAAITLMIRNIETDFLPLGKEIHVVGVMDGCMQLVPSLINRLWRFRIVTHCIKVASYQGTEKVIKPIFSFTEEFPKLRDKNVLLVDGIADTGTTLCELDRQIAEQKPAYLRTAVLVKRSTCKWFEPNYVGLHIATDEFIVGYGMDYKQHYRQLSEIKILPKK